MSTDTTILQGSFVSTGSNQFIPLRGGVEWMETKNVTSQATPANLDALSSSWQIGMPDNSGSFNLYVAASTACVEFYSTDGGYTLVDTSAQTSGVVTNTITAISTAITPVVTNTGVNGLVAGQIVRLSNCLGGAQALNGIDFIVGPSSLTNTTFELLSAPQLTTAGTTGGWSVINYDPIFYPRNRVISIMAPIDNTTSILTTIPHGLTVGQQIRLNISDDLYGNWVAANNVQTTIIEVTSNLEFTVSFNSSALGTFDFPVTATGAFTPAAITPFGENTPYAVAQGVNILADATLNTAQIGMLLKAGASEPAGSAGDLIYWKAGVSFSVDNN